MATDQQFCLRWNNHQSTLISVFDTLLENGTLVDCTLAAEGKYLKAHKVVLSACSPYLETLLSQHYEKHPIVILKDVKFTELKSMMDYMYRGEVNISQDQLGTFLKAAESLQIKGLSDNGDDATGPTTKRQEASARPSVTEVRNVETKRPAPSTDLSDVSREGSISPSSLRKRRRTRRSSQGDDPDSHLDSTSNACDFPINTSQTTTPLSVPSTTVVPTPVQNLPKQIVKQEPSISRIDNLNSTIAPESGLLKEKIEPPSEPLLEPKTEYLDYMNNENSIEVEDLTLDDDEDLDSSMDASRPGPSHGDMSNQGYQWPMSGDQSGTDEIFMAAQQAVGAATGQQRDSQVMTVMVNIQASISKLQKTVTSLNDRFGTLSEVQKQASRKVDTLLTTVGVSLPDQQPRVEVEVDLSADFPIRNLESLHNLEERLTLDDLYRPAMMQYFSKYGGRDVKTCTKILMQKILTDEIAQTFSWLGWKKKAKFSTLKLAEVIIEIVRLQFKNVTNQQVGESIQKWLVKAKERFQRHRGIQDDGPNYSRNGVGNQHLF